jgi:hypothetical protein
MRTRSAAALFAVVLAIPLAACADQPGDSGATPSPPTTAPGITPSVPVSPPALPSPPRGSPVPPPPTDKSGLVTLTGEVFAGVEPGCKLLAAGGQDYLLFGAAAEPLPMGATLTVRGTPQPGRATTCQQGIPFEVSEVLD